MSDYTGSSFISQPVEEELTGLTTLINDNKDANSATQALLDQEIYDRGAADTALQTDINTRALETALLAEASTRLQADEALSTRITNNSNAISTDAANLAQEIIDRGNADTALQTDINTRASQTSLNNEINTRTADDLALGVRITDNTTLIGTTNTNLSQEITDRQSADTGLQNQINDRALTLSLNNEITARTDADTALGVRIDFEASARQYYISNLQGQIDVNETAITTEETARTNADAGLQASITTNATAIGTKANDTDVVKLFSNQNIAGEKFFTNDTRIGGDVILPTDEGKIVLGSNNDRKIYWTAEGLGTNHAFQATRYDVAGGEQIASNNLADGSTLVKLLDGNVAIDGDVNITAGKAYKIDNVSIPTRSELDSKADNTALTAEASARESADTTLQASITANASAITAEETSRINADTSLQTTKANLDGGNTFTGEQDINGYAKIDRVIVQAVSNDYPPFRVTNPYSSFTSAQIDADKNALLVRSNTTLPGDSIISAYNNSKNDVVFKVGGDGKTHTKDIEGDGDVNLTAGKAYKIDNVSIPTHDDLALKAPIDNADLTGHTKMTRLTVNHSDSTTIGLDCNNTNVNQYAGAFNTAGFGWRFFNDNTSQVNNNTFGVFTKGTGASLNPLLIKNDGKVYTLDQEVDGDVNLSAGHEFKINGVPLSSGGMTPEQEAALNNNTSRLDDLYDQTGVELRQIVLLGGSQFDCRVNYLQHVEDSMETNQVPQLKIENLTEDLASKRALTNNLFPQLNLGGTTQYMTATGGTINGDDYFCEFDLTGLVNTDLVVGIAETNVYEQTKCIFIKTEDASNQTGNLIIRSNYLLTDQDIILRKKGDCVFLHADWDSSRWKVLGIFSNVQQTLTTTQSLVSERNVICQEHLFSNSAETTYIDGFTNINLRTPTSGQVPTISIDGQEAFMTKATTQTISGVKSFTSGIFSTEVSSKANFDLSLKTNDTDHKIDIANGSDVGLSQTLTKTSLNRALNIPYASVPLGTGGSNSDPPVDAVSGDIYRNNSNALHITP